MVSVLKSMKHQTFLVLRLQAFVPGKRYSQMNQEFTFQGVGGVRIRDDIIINETGGEVIQKFLVNSFIL